MHQASLHKLATAMHSYSPYDTHSLIFTPSGFLVPIPAVPQAPNLQKEYACAVALRMQIRYGIQFPFHIGGAPSCQNGDRTTTAPPHSYAPPKAFPPALNLLKPRGLICDIYASTQEPTYCGSMSHQRLLSLAGAHTNVEDDAFPQHAASLITKYLDTTTQHPLWNLRHNHGALDTLFREHFGIQARLSTPCQHPLGDFTTTTIAASSLTDVYPQLLWAAHPTFCPKRWPHATSVAIGSPTPRPIQTTHGVGIPAAVGFSGPRYQLLQLRQSLLTTVHTHRVRMILLFTNTPEREEFPALPPGVTCTPLLSIPANTIQWYNQSGGSLESRDHAPQFTGAALDPRSGVLVADPEDGRWDNHNDRNLNPAQVNVYLYHASDDEVTRHFTPLFLRDLTLCFASISAPIPATGPTHLDNPPVFLPTGKTLSLHNTTPSHALAIDPYREWNQSYYQPPTGIPESPGTIRPPAQLLRLATRSQRGLPDINDAQIPTAFVHHLEDFYQSRHPERDAQTFAVRSLELISQYEHLAYRRHLRFASALGVPTSLLRHATHADPPRHACDACGRYTHARWQISQCPCLIGDPTSLRRSLTQATSLFKDLIIPRCCSHEPALQITDTANRTYQRRAERSLRQALLHRLTDTNSPLHANVCFNCAFPTAQEAHSLLYSPPSDLEAARTLATKFYHTGQLPFPPTPPNTPSGSPSLDVWGRADWRDKRLLLPSGAIAIAVTVAPSASRPHKRTATTLSSSDQPSPPISSLSSAYRPSSATSTAPTPLAVWVRIVAPDVDSPPTSPLLDPDDFSKCTEISFEAAEIAHAAYHAWNPDTELHRRWSNAFPLPTRLPSAPEDNPTPPGATQPTSDNLSLPSPNRALSAMRDVLTSDPPVPPPKRRPRDSNSRRKFQKLKGLRYR